MSVEAAIYINQLDPLLPASTDGKSEGDNHIRLLKEVQQAQFPSLGAAPVTVTAAQLNDVVNKAPLASPTFTGVPAAPTAAAATATTQIATTAFVQAALAASAAPSSMILSIVAGTTQAAIASSHYVLNNGSATTVTLPASPAAGDSVWVTPGNGLASNIIARNGQNIMSLAEDMTIDNANATVQLRYINSTLGWRLT